MLINSVVWRDTGVYIVCTFEAFVNWTFYLYCCISAHTMKSTLLVCLYSQLLSQIVVTRSKHQSHGRVGVHILTSQWDPLRPVLSGQWVLKARWRVPRPTV